MNNWQETSNEYWNAAAFSFSDSFIQVATWVLLGLIIVTIFDHLTKNKFTSWVENSGPFQPLIAVIFGAIPGCGTALLLVPMYEQKKIRSGTLLALLISTSGDAAFILLGVQPMMWVWITVISMVVGIIVAYIVNYTPLGRILDEKFQVGDVYKHNINKRTCLIQTNEQRTRGHNAFDFIDSRIIAPIFMTSIITTVPLSIMNIIGVNLDVGVLNSYNIFISNLWVILGIAILFWYPIRHYLIIKLENKHYDQTTHCGLCNAKNEFDSQYQEIYSQLIFIMSWVLIANLSFNLMEVTIGKEVVIDFFKSGAGITAIFIGLFAGFLPGCGPTIIMTNLFISGTVSFASIMTTSIAQDGDVAMPLLAGSKPAFFVFKALSLIPALIIGIILILI